jgi:hypothetical protein
MISQFQWGEAVKKVLDGGIGLTRFPARGS